MTGIVSTIGQGTKRPRAVDEKRAGRSLFPRVSGGHEFAAARFLPPSVEDEGTFTEIEGREVEV